MAKDENFVACVLFATLSTFEGLHMFVCVIRYYKQPFRSEAGPREIMSQVPQREKQESADKIFGYSWVLDCFLPIWSGKRPLKWSLACCALHAQEHLPPKVGPGVHLLGIIVNLFAGPTVLG